MTPRYRVGLIVPSSNTTMETELPELFRRREQVAPERVTFHSARMKMTEVTPEALAAMDRDSDRCASDLADADCDVLAYACLVALMSAGAGAHTRAAQRLTAIASTDRARPVVTSAGALVDAAHALGAERVALIAPYLPPLTQRVIGYLADHDVEVVDAISLGVANNCAVGRLDPADLLGLIDRLDVRRAQALVLAVCVQLPSLAALPAAEALTGLPVLSAATATTFALLRALGLPARIPQAGCLLA
jgi:maleate isomerase